MPLPNVWPPDHPIFLSTGSQTLTFPLPDPEGESRDLTVTLLPRTVVGGEGEVQGRLPFISLVMTHYIAELIENNRAAGQKLTGK